MSAYLRLDAIARENNSGEAKRYKHLDWYKCPVWGNEIIVRRLSRHKDGHKFLNMWRIMSEVSCENPHGRRGYLSQGQTPYTPDDLEAKTGWKAKDFADAIAFFSSPEVGWMSTVAELPSVGTSSKQAKPTRSATPEHAAEHPQDMPHVCRKTSAKDAAAEGEGEGEGEGDSPLPHDSVPPGTTQGEGGEGRLTQEEVEARHHREYCRKEAKGLPSAFLESSPFRDAWCDWIAHLKAKHHKGFNPPFTTVHRHKRQIESHAVDDAIWALEEAMRRNLPFPADPSMRPGRTPASAAPSADNTESLRVILAEPESGPRRPVRPPERPAPRPEPAAA